VKEKTPEEWMTEIDNALHYRQEFGREDKWANLERTFMHDPMGDAVIGSNLIYSHGDSLISDLTVPDPEFLVHPMTRKAVQTAPIVERLDNTLVGPLKLKQAIDDGLIHNYLYGKTILKIGYDSLYGYSPYYDIGSRQQFMGMTMTMFDKKGSRLEHGNQRPGYPWIRAVMPQDFVVPWGTLKIEDASWCAFRFVRQTEYMKKDPKYKNTSRLEPDMNMEDFMASYRGVGARRQKHQHPGTNTILENSKLAFNEFWEIRDNRTQRVYVVSQNYDKFLRKDIDAIQMAVGGLPVVAGDFVPHPRSFWTTPLAYFLGQIQSEQQDISLQQAKQRRISILKFLVRKGVMKQEHLTRIMSGDVGAYEEVDVTTSVPLSEAIATMPTGSLLNFEMQLQSNQQDARDMIGQSRNQLGEYDRSSRRTAREATFVQQGSAKRSNKRGQMVQGLYTKAIQQVNQLIFKFWQTPRDMMVDNGWQMITGAQLDQEYAYDVSLAMKRQISKAERKMEAFQTLVQFIQLPGMTPQILQQLYANLQDAANDPAFERLLPSPGSNQGGRSPSGGMPTIAGTS
jgi:hypothetical protein